MDDDSVVEPAVHIQASFAPKISLAFHQNAVPLLRELAVVNGTEAPLSDLTLTLTSEPGFLQSKAWRIDAVGAGQRFHLPELDVALDGGLLSRLTEAEAAQVQLILQTGEQEVVRFTQAIELLPRNQWGGATHMPELVATFIQPNDPAVDRILKRVAEVLRQNGREPALNGYADGAKRAWELTSAIWAAISSLGLDYALPPASFEQLGQKVRSPSQILGGGLATCLDTTLLFCACLEQCGLNPLVVFTRGHAFAGVWLKAEEFPSAVVDDVTALRKRIQLKELVLFETTLATQRPACGFSRAAERGGQQVSETERETFELAVGVRRARMQRIRPLANAETIETPVASGQVADLEPAFEAAPDLPDEEIIVAEVKPSTPGGRLDRWQRKLLDLSLRNNLLNFRASKRVLKLDVPDPAQLEDRLAEGDRIKLLARPALMDGEDPRNLRIHEGRHHEDARRGFGFDALKRGEVLVDLPQPELEARLVELYRSARMSLQEGGANTLFVALGFLAWTRDDKDDKRYRAPLILLPVTLERKSVRSGFSLLLHEDEPRFNPTLLEMLRQDFKLNIAVADGELPKDAHGLDVAGIWRAVAQAVKDIKGWEVIEDVVLSTFSFAKHLMWKDLVERTEQLKQNPVVRHLLDTPRESYPSSQAFPDPRALDQSYVPEQSFCPLPADSSQLSAVVAAANGKDFVLVGPPGTGKSQTIANLIAQCLAERKTVLFVSEKIAALDVVYRRLREVGLADFCLELHSSKARKLDVLDQLRRSWAAKGSVDAGAWQHEARRLKALRDQLNTFVEHLHRKRRNGLTAYTAIGRVLAGRDSPALGLAWPSADAHDVNALDALRGLAERLDVNAAEVGAISNSPLALIAHDDWSPSWQQSMLKAAQDLIPPCAEIETAADRFLRSVGLPDTELNRRARDGLAVLARALPEAAGRDWRFALRPDVRTVTDGLRRGLDLLARHRERKDLLAAPWRDELIQGLKRGLELVARHRETAALLSVPYAASLAQLDVIRLKASWSKADKSWFPMNWLARRAVSKALTGSTEGAQEPNVAADLDQLVALRALESDIAELDRLKGETGGLWAGMQTPAADLQAALTFQAALSAALAGEPWRDEGLSAIAEGRGGPELAADLARMREMRVLEREVAGLGDLSVRTNGLWTGLMTRVEEAERALAFQAGLSAAIAGLASTEERLVAIKAPLERLLGDGNALLDPAGPVAGAGWTYADALARFQQAVDAFASLAGAAPADVEKSVDDTPAGMAAACRQVLPLAPKLHAWCAWRKVRTEAIATGMAPLVDAIENGSIALGRVRQTFEADYARWWLNVTVDGDEVLRNFVSAEHEKRIADFTALDERFTGLTRSYVRAGLCGGLPDQNDVARSSEWGLLRREMEKKRRHLPLRELVSRIPSALGKLTPCLLMSPLSIAQYLPADTAIFDVVVFDEASQIPVWDAVGAIARGRQVVMVGDPKQLPPTSFFDRAHEDADDDIESDTDLESILDECLGANLPTLDLRWHYRSRHESLIAFSNHRYYGGSLVTFPSPVTEDRAVSFHLVDGVYEKGGARINKPEAAALVADLISRLKDPEFVASRKTIGVVTFNSEQQRLIEDLLDAERHKNPAIEPYFAEDALEPVFVKNLESVQGDERDVMYFSIAFGPDRSGAISMNFGPMNREGGERRLNVAITRARYELRVFSSLRPNQIDLSRTQAVGVRDLKHFLEFAERGPRALAEAVFGMVGDFESPFEQAVAEAMAQRGWQLHPQVGVSSFRIDLGVVDPDAPGRYLAGVECDGATYHRSATARDRDKLREQVLRGLGWEIVRIWSTDWWHDASGALDKVDARLKALLDTSRARRAAEAAIAAAASEAGEASESATQSKLAEAVAPIAEAAERQVEAGQGDSLVLSSDYAGNAAAATAPQPAAVFRESDPAAAVEHVRPEVFFDPAYAGTLAAMIQHVVTAEGPLRDDVLAKRIARAHGWSRTGRRIRDHVLNAAENVCILVADGNDYFAWPRQSDTSQWSVFRRPASGAVRPVDEIALPELAALAREVILEGLDGDVAFATMARVAGLQKLRAASRERFEAAWEYAQRSLQPADIGAS